MYACFYVCCNNCVWVCGKFVVQRPLLKIVFFSLGVLQYSVCLRKGCDGCCVSVCIVTRGAIGARVWEV